MRHPTTEALYAYWNEMRRDRVAPQRLEVQPARIGNLLPDTFILERVDSQTFRFRLAGTRLCARFGMELRSLNFLNLWSDGDRAMLEEHLAASAEAGRVGLFTGELMFANGRAAPFEILVLPLVHTGQAIDRFLCSMSLIEEPQELGEDRIAEVRLLAAEGVWPEGQPYEPDATSADRQSPLHPHVRTARIVRQDRRQFRVYNGGLSDGEAKR